MDARAFRKLALALAASLLLPLLALQPARANVSLSYFLAIAGNRTGQIALTWGTETEADAAAFRLLRGIEPVFASAQLIHQAQPRGSAVSGADYAYLDSELVPEQRYYYWLVGIANSGQELLLATAWQIAPGEVGPSPRRLFLPVVCAPPENSNGLTS